VWFYAVKKRQNIDFARFFLRYYKDMVMRRVQYKIERDKSMKKLQVSLVFYMVCLNAISLQAVTNKLFDLKYRAYKVGDELYSTMGKEGVLAILLGTDKKLPDPLVKLIDTNAAWMCKRQAGLEDATISVYELSKINGFDAKIVQKLKNELDAELNKIPNKMLAECKTKSQIEVFAALAHALADELSAEKTESKQVDVDESHGCTIV
jgi:hypothetical protein